MLGQELNLPTANTPTYSPGAKSLDVQYLANQAQATHALQNQGTVQPLTVGDLAQMQGVSATPVNAVGPSRVGQALLGVGNIALGCLEMAGAGVAAAGAETGVGAVVAVVAATAGAGQLAAGVTLVIGAMTGQTQAAATGAAVATAITSASGATTMIVTGGNLQTAQNMASAEAVVTGTISFSSSASQVENAANAASLAKGIYDLHEGSKK